jgi:hypothetical protein
VQSRPLRIATRASFQTPATEEARRRAGTAVLGTRATKAPASGSGRPTEPPSRRTARSAAAEDGERSTTTTRATRGAAVEAGAGAALTRSAAASAPTVAARHEDERRPGGCGLVLVGGRQCDERVRRMSGVM